MKRAIASIIVVVFFASASFAAELPARGGTTRIGEPPLPVRAKLDESCGLQVAFSPNDHRLLTEYAGSAQIWDAQNFKPVGKPILRGRFIQHLSFVQDGSTVFIASNPDASLAVLRAQYFDSATAKAIDPDFNLGNEWPSAVSSEDGKYFAASTVHWQGDKRVHEVRVIERSTGRAMFSKLVAGLSNDPEGIRLSHDGSFLSYQEDGDAYPHDFRMRLVRLHDGKLLFDDALRIPNSDFGYRNIDFSPDGKSVVVGDEKGFKTFDLVTERMMLDSPAFDAPAKRGDGRDVSRVRFSPDGRFVLAGRRGIKRRCSAANGAALSSYNIPFSEDNMSFSRDCGRMSCWYESHAQGRTVGQGFAVLQLDTGRIIWQWPRPEGSTGHTATTADGRYVAVSDSETRSVYILDLNDLLAPK